MFFVSVYCIVSIFTPVTFCLFVRLFLQVVVGDRGTDADSAESADEGGVGRRPGRQNPDESAEHREEERVSQKNHKKQEYLSSQSINQSFSLSLSFALYSCVLLLSQKLSLVELHHAVQSLRGSEARLASQKALLDAKMATAASPPPPPPPPALPYEDDARSVGSTVNSYYMIIGVSMIKSEGAIVHS